MKLFVIIFIFLFNVSVFSQHKTGLVEYGHKQSMGLGAPIGVDYNAVLIFDLNTSKYTFAKDSLEGGFINKSMIIKKDKENVFVKPKRTSKNGYQVYVNHYNEMLSRNKGYSYVKENLPKIYWNILNEKKIIGNFECVKAIGSFRGREYTAWYTPSIPIPYGPWKLQGLPGLILEAYDTKKEVYFYFKSIKYPLNEKISIQKPLPIIENEKWISFSMYKERLLALHKQNVQNGRMIVEQYDGVDPLENKMPMRNSFIEVFDED